MIVYHIFFDLNYLGIVPGASGNMPVTIIGRAAFIIFLLICGVSLSLSRSKVLSRKEKPAFLKFLKRGLFIFSLGLIITLATKIFIGDGYIIFGILHLIGLSVIIAYPFLKFTYLNILLGISILIFGFTLLNYSFSAPYAPYFLWLGFKPEGFYTLDYFPVLPFFGFVLLGIAAGNMLYKNHQRAFPLQFSKKSMPTGMVEFLGKNSLPIYLIHQPVIIAIIMAFSFFL